MTVSVDAWDAATGGRARRIPNGVGAAVGAGLAVRLVWMVFAVGEPRVESDELFYFESAQGLADGAGYIGPSGEPTAFWAPGYSMVLAMAFWLVEHSPLPDDLAWTAATLNLAFAGLVIWLVFQLAVETCGRRVGLAAAWLVALWPNNVFYSSLVLSEGLFTALVASALWVLVRGSLDGIPSARRLRIAGGLLGCAALVRPVGAVVLAAIPLVWLWHKWPTREVLRATAQLVVVALAVIAPWTIRNAVEFGQFVPIGTHTGTALCIGNNPSATGGFGFYEECVFETSEALPDEAVVDNHNRSEALKWIIENPVEQFRLVPERLRLTFRMDHDGLVAAGRAGFVPSESVARSLRLVADSYYVVFMLGAVGGLVLVARRALAGAVIVGAVLSLVVVVMPFWGVPRYHQPVLALAAVPAAAALAGVWDWARAAVSEPSIGAQKVAEPTTMRRPLTPRRLLLVLEVVVVLAALAVLAVGYVRARPSFSRTTLATSFESEARDIGSEPNWTVVGGQWTVEAGEVAARPDGPDRPTFLLTPIDSQTTQIDVDITKPGRNGGLVLRYVDDRNYWSMLYRPAFAAWDLLRVVDGVEERVDTTGSVAVSTNLPVEVEVRWDPNVIEFRAGRTDVRVIDGTHGDGDRAGLMLDAGGDVDLRWGAITVTEIAALDSDDQGTADDIG